MEYTWYGYASFLFKMWVQTSVAHNMVTVDLRMQEPTPCEPVLYHQGESFQAVCAQTISRWCDPPYGGQTPYPIGFPRQKCEMEGRYVIYPEHPRRQGELGEYSEPVFQRRLLVMPMTACIIPREALKSRKGACLRQQNGCVMIHTARGNLLPIVIGIIWRVRYGFRLLTHRIRQVRTY